MSRRNAHCVKAWTRKAGAHNKGSRRPEVTEPSYCDHCDEMILGGGLWWVTRQGAFIFCDADCKKEYGNG